MQSQKHIGTSALLCLLAIAGISLSSPVDAGEKQWVVLRDNIPLEIERFSIGLTFTPANSSFYDNTEHGIKSTEIKETKDSYKHQIDFGAMIDGYQYAVMLKDAGDVNIISRDSERMCQAKVIRFKDGKKPETLREGLVVFHREMSIPLEVPAEQLSVPFDDSVKGTLQISIYSNNPPVYEGRCRTILNGELSGSTSTNAAFLSASIMCRNSLELKSRFLTLSLKPFSEQMAPTVCNGKLSETLMLGAAKLVVEKIASDGSELTLALLDGDLETAIKQEIPAAEGNPFPAFARVELIRRQLLTLDDLKRKSGDDGYIVLIFGNFRRTIMPEFYGGRPDMRFLSLDESMICDILKKDSNKPIIIGFICQQLSLPDMYERWLGRDPEYYVFSDFSNPLDVQFFIPGMQPHRMRPYDRGVESLRSNLKFGIDKIITGLIDGNGDIVYLNTDAGNELANSLVRINTLIREGKRAKE